MIWVYVLVGVASIATYRLLSFYMWPPEEKKELEMAAEQLAGISICVEIRYKSKTYQLEVPNTTSEEDARRASRFVVAVYRKIHRDECVDVAQRISREEV